MTRNIKENRSTHCPEFVRPRPHLNAFTRIYAQFLPLVRMNRNGNRAHNLRADISPKIVRYGAQAKSETERVGRGGGTREEALQGRGGHVDI